MPELPEVETIRRTLEPQILDRRIRDVRVHHAHVTGDLAARAFAAAVRDRRIARTWRRGKYMVFGLEAEAQPALALVCHLRMTGRLCYLGPRRRWRESAAHTHATLRLEGGGRLIFHDVRKFGRLTLVDPARLGEMLPAGRDPIADGLSPADLQGLLAGKRGTLKGLLLRQDLLCGLGNIYADEALHRAGLHPCRSAADIDPREAARLAHGIVEVLQEALAFRGTTLLDYRTGEGERGAFARYLRVYGRAGRPCRACGAPVAAIRVAGRTTAFCPACQPERPETDRPRV